MISKMDMEKFFALETIGSNVFKCKDATPSQTLVYYLCIDDDCGRNILLVSDGVENDQFAANLIEAVRKLPCEASRLLKHKLPSRTEYNFSHALYAPSTFHHYLKGRLDDDRERLFLCLPIHNCEFSGDEPKRVFFDIRRHLNSGLIWDRPVTPRIVMRFENGRTLGGTKRSGAIVSTETLRREIDNLNGADGFIQVTAYRGDSAEILSPEAGVYSFNAHGGAGLELTSRQEVHNRVWEFLVSE